MKNKENFPKASNEQIENLNSYPEPKDISNSFDIEPEDISKNRSDEAVDEESEWKEMNFDLLLCGDDLDDVSFEFDDEQENSSNADE